jgi:ABC-2 type transport system permease protein
MATSLQTTVQAMRLLRWPADRLDTRGGFLTYHNVTLFALGLSLYAAVQGARAVRGAEASGVPAEILATGRSRPGVLLDRAVGFGLSLALICLGLGGGIALAMAAYGEPDLAVVRHHTRPGCAFWYAVGVLVSPLLRPPARTGVAALLLTFCLSTWQDLALGAIRFISPFYYFNFSRAGAGYGLTSHQAFTVGQPDPARRRGIER